MIIQASGTFSTFLSAAKAAGWLVIMKADGYVLESDVHFPMDMNLLWDTFLQTDYPPLKEKFLKAVC